MLHMLQWINIVDNVTNTIQKPVVWTRVFIYQFGKHHGGCAVYTTSEPLWFWDLQKRTALFKFSKNLEGDLGEHRQPLLRSGTISRSIVMKELAKIFLNKPPSKYLLNLNSAVRFCKSQNHKGSLTWCKLHAHHDVFQTNKWRPLFKPRAFGWCWLHYQKCLFTEACEAWQGWVH